MFVELKLLSAGIKVCVNVTQINVISAVEDHTRLVIPNFNEGRVSELVVAESYDEVKALIGEALKRGGIVNG